MDPYQRLAAAIIMQAVDDLNKAASKRNRCKKQIEKLKMQCKDYSFEREILNKSNRQISETMTFFNSQWCMGLCDFIGIEYEAVMDKVRGQILEAK